MHWGDYTIDWNTLARVCVRLKRHHHLRSRLAISTSDIAFLYQRFIAPDQNTHHANRFNFVYELQRARHLRFSDDRDRIFAFLSHFSARSGHSLGCGPVSIPADYNKTVEQLYIDFAVRMLRENPSKACCILLAAVQHPRSGLPSTLPSHSNTQRQSVEAGRRGGKDGHNKLLRLPSWVPDWRRSCSILLAEPICPHRAHGSSVAKVDILGEDGEEDGLILQVHGLEVDTIEACSTRPLVSGDFYRQHKKTPDGSPATVPMLEQVWRGVCENKDDPGFNLDHVYLPNGQTAFFAFMQTLSNGCVQAAGHNSVPYHEVPDGV